MKYTFKKLAPKQYDRLSEIIGNLSLVFFAGLVLPVFNGLDKADWNQIIWGLLLTAICVILSLLLSRK